MSGVVKNANPSFLNGVPELLILQLLAQQERYGYDLIKAIQARTQAQLSFGEGCIYPHLHHLEEAKLLASSRRRVEGRDRVYYRLTARGRKRLAALARDWDRVATGVSLVLGGQHA